MKPKESTPAEKLRTYIDEEYYERTVTCEEAHRALKALTSPPWIVVVRDEPGNTLVVYGPFAEFAEALVCSLTTAEVDRRHLVIQVTEPPRGT